MPDAGRAGIGSRAALVGRWVGANAGMLEGWVVDEDAALLVATVRIPLTPEELTEYRALT